MAGECGGAKEYAEQLLYCGIAASESFHHNLAAVVVDADGAGGGGGGAQLS